MSEFSTRVSEVSEGCVNLRGYSLEEVMREVSYTDGLYLCILGKLPKPSEKRLLDALLNSLLDHGFVASTITAARFIASGNPQFIPAVAGGLLASGSNTVSPEHAFDLLSRAESVRVADQLSFEEAAKVIVDEYAGGKRRIPGFGHPTHKSNDFRADVLFEIADESQLTGSGIRQYREVHRQFVLQTGKTSLPINIDGALAAIGYDMGWTATQTVALAILSVMPGIMAHVIEELEEGRPLRHIRDGQYDVAPLSPLPKLSMEGIAR